MSVSRPKVLALNRELKQARDYWVGRLSGEVETAGPRPDFERPPRGPLTRDTLRVEFSEALAARVSKLTNNSPFLTYTTLLAALQVCLRRHTGARVVAVGCPPRIREDAPAPAPNALAVVGEVDGRESFRQLLLKTRESLLEAMAWQGYPYERLLKDLGLGDERGRCPLFDVSLAFRNIHGALPEVAQDIAMTFESAGTGEIRGVVEYRRELFTRESVERFAGHWMNLLGAALADLAAPLASLEMLGEAERQRLVREWNETAAPYPSESTFQQLFEEQAERTPSAVAVSFEGERLTYAELNRRANQLAHYLRARGVGPEVLVGISLPRSAELLVALLGVFKAGGAYVPLDLKYPKERVAYMLEDARVPLLLTLKELLPELPETSARVVCLDAEAEAVAAGSAENPENFSSPENAAYVIYTSGSTGRPKGVVVRHGGLCNLTEAQRLAFKVEPGEHVLQFSSLNFDASIFEIVMALRGGAAVYLAASETLLPGADLLRFLREQEISNVTLPPSALLVTPVAELPALRTVIVAGEACPAELVARWAGGRRFFNAYGPTETTVWATVAQCADGEEKPPIGGPIANARAYVLDERAQPIPVGVSGELYLGGAGVARGYLNRPALTAERFVPDVFSGETGARLYRTGDVARWRADGQLEFVGRADNQVKVRGYRIELGEVEAVLSAIDAVREAVVEARGGTGAEKRLVAYVVWEESAGAAERSVTELRRRLKERLPDYMTPSQFVALAEMPLTPNGKVDRKALPEPEERGDADDVSDEARTPVEELLCGIWSEVLGVERVGVDEDFFELGGHSLLATQVASRTRETCGVELPLRQLFESPTVRALAAAVEEAQRAGAGVNAPPVVAVSRERELPLSFAQQRLWFLDQLEPGSPFYNIPAAVRLSGGLDVRALEGAFRDLVRRHESLRTTFAARDGRPLQVVSEPEGFTLAVEDLSVLVGEQASARAHELAVEEARRPFDLGRGPLLRVRLLRLGAEEHVLLLTMHHIVSDGWSMGVLVRELVELYAARREGREARLTPLPIQYADFAVWQREWLSGEVLERQLEYWRGQLENAPRLLELPTDRPRPAVQTFQGANASFDVAAGVARSLKELARRAGVTLFMTLLAAFDLLLMRYTGREDVVVGTNIANRNRAETENLIGFFVNNLVLRTDLSGDPTFRELLGRVREVCLGAYLHQDMPFDKLVEELRPERVLSHHPLFQVMFVLQNAPRAFLEAPGLSFGTLGVARRVSRFDLLVNVTETPEGLHGSVEYNTDLFDAQTVDRMFAHLLTLLEAIAEEPDRRLRDFTLVGEADSLQLIHAFNESLD